jgi:twitching motility protein PilT
LREAPAKAALHREFSNQGLEVIGVNLGEDPETVRKFAREMGIHFLLLLDREDRSPRLFGVWGHPNTILIGELRDRETIEAALTIAETGHLTFGTLHTNSAVQTVNRLVDAFPIDSRPQVRAQLSFVLEGVLCQALMPKASGQGRVLVLEIMVPNAAIRNLIREDKVHQIYSSMQTGQEKFGMQTQNQALLDHYVKRNITMEQAVAASTRPDELMQMIQRAQPGAVAGARR